MNMRCDRACPEPDSSGLVVLSKSHHGGIPVRKYLTKHPEALKYTDKIGQMNGKEEEG